MAGAEIHDEPSRSEPENRGTLSSRYLGGEYEVVRLGFRPLPVAYGAFVAVFVWAQLYWRFWPGATWQGVSLGAFVIASIGCAAAWQAKRKARRLDLPVLIALILDFGVLLAIVVPAIAFYVVFTWPR